MIYLNHGATFILDDLVKLWNWCCPIFFWPIQKIIDDCTTLKLIIWKQVDAWWIFLQPQPADVATVRFSSFSSLHIFTFYVLSFDHILYGKLETFPYHKSQCCLVHDITHRSVWYDLPEYLSLCLIRTLFKGRGFSVFCF